MSPGPDRLVQPLSPDKWGGSRPRLVAGGAPRSHRAAHRPRYRAPRRAGGEPRVRGSRPFGFRSLPRSPWQPAAKHDGRPRDRMALFSGVVEFSPVPLHSTSNPRGPAFHHRPTVLGAVKVRPSSPGARGSVGATADLDRPCARKEVGCQGVKDGIRPALDAVPVAAVGVGQRGVCGRRYGQRPACGRRRGPQRR